VKLAMSNPKSARGNVLFGDINSSFTNWQQPVAVIGGLQKKERTYSAGASRLIRGAQWIEMVFKQRRK
jgi:hypothetical protein